MLVTGLAKGEGLVVCQEIVELAEDDFSSTVIHDAVLGINGISVEMAIQLEPGSLNSPNSLGHKPIHLAAALHNHEALETLLCANADIEARDGLFRTPLHTACRNGNLFAVTTLLNAGSDVNAVTDINATPLHLALLARWEPELYPQAPNIVNALLEAKAHVGIKCRGRWSPLSYFIQHSGPFTEGDMAIIDALIDAGANGDDLISSGSLLCFASFGEADCNRKFKFLHSRGARLDIMNGYGETLLHFVAWWGDLEVINYLRALPTLDLDPDAKNGGGVTPLDMMNDRKKSTSEEISAEWWNGLRIPTEEEDYAFQCLLDELRDRRARNNILIESLALRDLDAAL